MTALLPLLALFFAPAMHAADAGLSASLEKARREFSSARGLAAEAESAAAPLAETVRELKAVKNPWWWTRWRLRRNLGQLQESLDRLREARSRYEQSRQELFL